MHRVIFTSVRQLDSLDSTISGDRILRHELQDSIYGDAVRAECQEIDALGVTELSETRARNNIVNCKQESQQRMNDMLALDNHL